MGMFQGVAMTLWIPSQDERRHPTTAELGLDVTVGIAANSIPYGHIVAVSDQQISYTDGFFPPLEKGSRKILQIAPMKRWFLAFAADDVTVMQQLLTRIIDDLRSIDKHDYDAQWVRGAICKAYFDVRVSQFTMRHLSAIGYSSFEDFKRDGLQELGKDEHQKHMVAFYQFDLGVELLVFGFSKDMRPVIFSVGNPGKHTDWNWQGYSAVGSGTYLALGALRQKPLNFGVDELVYRLLDAKFVAEASSTVGSTTTLIVLRYDGEVRELHEREIGKIKEVWEEKRKEPPPAEAMNVIQKSRVISGFGPS